MLRTLTRRMGPTSLALAALLTFLAPPAGAQRATARQKAAPAPKALTAADARRALGLAGGDLLTLDVPALPGASIVVPVALGGAHDLLALSPHSVQAAGYRVLVQAPDGGFTPAPAGLPRTLRGELLGLPGSQAAASLLDDGLHVRVRLPDGQDLWIEPLVGRVAGATGRDYVAYRDADVLDMARICGADALPDATLHAAPRTLRETAPGAEAATGLKVAQLACDADFEFFQHWGSTQAVEDRIHAVINSMNLQYEADVGITHEITTVLVRTSASQPYTSTDASTLLNQFRSQWNASHGNVVRDVAQLFTGKQIDGSTIGIAWVGVVCNLSYAYGVVQSDFNGNFAYATDLSAHELGHNWGASHCTCTSYTMNPYITAANQFNPVGTIPTITAFRDGASCLADGGGDPPPPPPPPEPGANLATADWSTGQGQLTSGSYLSTHASDDAYEVLTEQHTGGSPKNRKSVLQHTWTFDVSAGTGYEFAIEAHHQANTEGDHFLLSYSRDLSAWTPMLTVTKTVDDDLVQTYAFGEDVAGTLYVRVEDTDQTTGNGSTQSLSVDRMVVTTSSGGPDTLPPAAPAGLVASGGNGTVSLDWDDVADADLAGYTVRRSTVAGGPYAPLTGLLGASAYVDAAVVNGTTYHYVVTASDGSGNVSAASAPASATPHDPGAGPAFMHVASITVTTANVTAGYKQGVALVVVRDELGGAVQGATVTGTFSGGLSQTVSALTDASGTATLATIATAKGGFALTCCVTSLTHGTLAHDPGADVTSCGSK